MIKAKIQTATFQQLMNTPIHFIGGICTLLINKLCTHLPGDCCHTQSMLVDATPRQMHDGYLAIIF